MTDTLNSEIAPPPPPDMEPDDKEEALELSAFPRANIAVTRLTKILAETSGLDATLLTLQYPLLLLLALPRRKPTPRLRALIGLISDIRIFLRLPGLLKIYLWALQTIKKPPTDGILTTITWSQIVSSTAFQALENAAYLSQHGIMGLDGKQRSAAAKWSARAWAAHVFLDLLRLGRVRQIREQAKASSGLEKEDKIARKTENKKWWRDFVVNTAYAPLTVHYSLESGAVGELWIGLLGSIVSAVSWNTAWEATA